MRRCVIAAATVVIRIAANQGGRGVVIRIVVGQRIVRILVDHSGQGIFIAIAGSTWIAPPRLKSHNRIQDLFEQEHIISTRQRIVEDNRPEGISEARPEEVNIA